MDFGSYANTQDKNTNSSKHENTPPTGDTIGEVFMEVPVTSEEVMRARGFGATDDLSSILPAARDCTDFEDHLRDVRGYEDSEDKIAGVWNADVEDMDTVKEHVDHEPKDSSEEVNMEASVTPDEVTRAGGFGATDNISSFLPVASDFTDFEANLRDAREYEDLNEEIKRPGLGWTSEPK